MKKWIALFLATLMIFSLSLASAEDTFEANLAAFLSEMNVSENDILLSFDMQGQKLEAQLGKDDAGVHGNVSMAGTVMGEAMITEDAAYLSAMGQGYKLQFATLTAFAEKYMKANLGDLQISTEQLTADLQMLVMKAYPYVADFAGAFTMEEVENGSRMVINSPALAEALTKAIDGILLDEEVAACLDRYFGILAATGTEIHAADLQNAWNGKKEQIKELIANSDISLTLYNDQTYDLQVLFANGEEKAGLLSKGTLQENMVDTLTTIGIVGKDPEATLAFKFVDNVLTYDMTTAEVNVHEEIVVEGDQLKSIDYVIVSEGTTMVEMHYAGDHVSMKFEDASLDADITVREAKRMEAVATFKQGEVEQVITGVLELQDDALVITLTANETPVVITLSKTAKGTWTDLSKAEGLVELTEDMLSSLIPMN